MEVLHKNLKEDLKLLVSLGTNYSGESFSLHFYAGKYSQEEFTCSFDKDVGEYVNCEKADDTHALCLLNNHGLPCGLLGVHILVYEDDPMMPDGNFKLDSRRLVETEYQGKTYHIELTNGNSDIVETTEADFTLLGTVLRGEKGEKGDRGEKGSDGAPGAPGRDGVDGKDGKDGKDGAPGGVLYPSFDIQDGHLIAKVPETAADMSVRLEEGHLILTV